MGAELHEAAGIKCNYRAIFGGQQHSEILMRADGVVRDEFCSLSDAYL